MPRTMPRPAQPGQNGRGERAVDERDIGVPSKAFAAAAPSGTPYHFDAAEIEVAPEARVRLRTSTRVSATRARPAPGSGMR